MWTLIEYDYSIKRFIAILFFILLFLIIYSIVFNTYLFVICLLFFINLYSLPDNKLRMKHYEYYIYAA